MRACSRCPLRLICPLKPVASGQPAMQQIPDRAIAAFIAEQCLPASYREQAETWFLPLARRLRGLAQAAETPLKIGVSGAQGSGKTTLAALLARILASWGLRVAALSLDDFYLRRAERLKLAESVHPLLATRGVPGTHELDLLASTLEALTRCGEGDSVPLPAFDKSIDDRVEPSAWTGGRPGLILLEGWFTGLGPQAQEELDPPVNALEAEADPAGRWRRFVNDKLAEYHGRVFSGLDKLIFLRAPDFGSVHRWRGLQERKLEQSKLREKAGPEARAIMNEAQLRRFISHYERLTRHALATLPEVADWMFVLDENQTVVARVDRMPAARL